MTVRAVKQLLVGLWLLVLGCASAQDLQPVPALTARVIDQAGKLDARQRQGLEAKLAAFEQKKGSQIVFLLVRTTQPEDIASYANRVGNSWKIGRAGVGDAVLLVVAVDDRKTRIEVSKALEGAVPDVVAGRIVDEQLRPYFLQDDFAGGLQAAADQLIARISGEALPEPARAEPQRHADETDWLGVAAFAFILIPYLAGLLRGLFGTKAAVLLTSGGMGMLVWLWGGGFILTVVAILLAALWSLVGAQGGGGGSGGGWSGSSGSSDRSGGGGFSSGGGGDFGGGGASGDW
jgi:uncharacterized protein